MGVNTPLHGNESNVRPYGIFITYMVTCLTLAVFIIVKLFVKTERSPASTPSRLSHRSHVLLFAVLAAGSLLSTWTFMFQYFQWSYDNWLTVRSQHSLDPSVKHWGLWLKETSLFKEAWESVLIGQSRYWWSHQIFFFASALGLHSEWKGVRHGITYTWAFMLLGQIVAISFATNLYFLTLLISPQEQRSTTLDTKEHSKKSSSLASASGHLRWFGPWLVDGLSVLSTGAAADLLSREKYQHGAPGFMQILLLPHAFLMILPTLRAILPRGSLPLGDAPTSNKIYKFLWFLNAQFLGRLLWTTYKAYEAGNIESILRALLEHPAVSSVGLDVVFCWISWISWWQTRGDETSSFSLKMSWQPKDAESDEN